MGQFSFDNPKFTEKQVVKPGAKERIEEKLKTLEEVNRLRPCKKCVNSVMERPSYIGGRCNTCNFNHDNFRPINLGQSPVKRRTTKDD